MLGRNSLPVLQAARPPLPSYDLSQPPARLRLRHRNGRKSTGGIAPKADRILPSPTRATIWCANTRRAAILQHRPRAWDAMQPRKMCPRRTRKISQDGFIHFLAGNRAVSDRVLRNQVFADRSAARDPNARVLASSTFQGRFFNPQWRRHFAHPIVIGWVGPLFWPYAYSDFVDYTFYPYAYDTFWPYAYDDVYDGMFGAYALGYGGTYAAVGPAATMAAATLAAALIGLPTLEAPPAAEASSRPLQRADRRADGLADRADRANGRAGRCPARRARRAQGRHCAGARHPQGSVPDGAAEHADGPARGHAPAARCHAAGGAHRAAGPREVLSVAQRRAEGALQCARRWTTPISSRRDGI